MHCEICLTFEHQLRHYEVEIKTRVDVVGVPPAGAADIAIRESLDELKEELNKTQALYRRHRERGHRVALRLQDPAGAVE